MTNKKQPNFGEWLTRQLEARGITSNVKAGEKIGVSHSTVRSWKRGEAQPTLGNYEAIAELFGVGLWRVLAEAGKIDPGEIGASMSAADLPTDELMDEVRRRMTDS